MITWDIELERINRDDQARRNDRRGRGRRNKTRLLRAATPEDSRQQRLGQGAHVSDRSHERRDDRSEGDDAAVKTPVPLEPSDFCPPRREAEFPDAKFIADLCLAIRAGATPK